MSLTIALQSALSGLRASQTAMGVTSTNIANATTEGYTRKTVSYERGLSGGVNVTGITRSVDNQLLKELRNKSSEIGVLNVQDGYYVRMQDMFGSPQSQTSLVADVNRMAEAFSNLALSPEILPNAEEAVRKALATTNKVNRMSADIQNLRAEADQEISRLLNIVNVKLDEVRGYNLQLSQAKANGFPYGDFADRRDQALQEVSEIIDITTLEREDGQQHVYLRSGVVLLDASVKELSHSPASSLDAPAVYPGAIDAIDVEEYGDITTFLNSGQLKGLVDMRDTILPGMAAQLEEFSENLKFEVNRIHNKGTAFPAPASLTGTQVVADGDAFAGTGLIRIARVDENGAYMGAPDVLNLNLATVATVGALRAAINASLGAGTATINGSGQLVISGGAGRIAINENTSEVGADDLGFSHYFGLNDFFIGSDDPMVAGDLARNITVRDSLQSNGGLIAKGALDLTALPFPVLTQDWPQAITSGNKDTLQDISNLFTETLNFSAAGGLPAAARTLLDYAGSILGFNAVNASSVKERLESSEKFLEEVSYRVKAQSGVNIDEELSQMIVIETSYNAAARVVGVIQEMFDALENVI